MTSSGSYGAFNPEVADICIEAWERLGKDPGAVDGYVSRSCRRSLNFMFADWSTVNINLWKIDLQNLLLSLSQATVAMPAGTIAQLDTYIRQTSTGQDLILTPMSRSQYAALANKAQSQRPTGFYFDRQIAPISYLWPISDSATEYTLYYYRLAYIQDVTSAAETLDLPQQWFEAIAAGLAARLAEKYAPDRQDKLEAKAADALKRAVESNGQKVPMSIRPDTSVYNRVH